LVPFEKFVVVCTFIGTVVAKVGVGTEESTTVSKVGVGTEEAIIVGKVVDKVGVGTEEPIIVGKVVDKVGVGRSPPAAPILLPLPTEKPALLSFPSTALLSHRYNKAMTIIPHNKNNQIIFLKIVYYTYTKK